MNEGSRWAAERTSGRGPDYDEKWQRMAEAGQSVHGEADFVGRTEPTSVLDAGCGTGRVAIELGRRGIDVVGVDLDPAMLDVARTKAPTLEWVEESIEQVDLGRTFDVVVTAGNVMIFVTPGSEGAVVRNLARHVAPRGRMISGFQLNGGYDLDRYDADCAAAGLELAERYSTWTGEPWSVGDDYAVSVHIEGATLDTHHSQPGT